MDLEHGGNLSAAARRFNIPLQQWIDLSTGISPWSWPVPTVPQSVWQALPYADEQLEQAAAVYYRCSPKAVLAVPGSQYALQYAPALLDRGRVAMPQRGYAEHRVAWIKAGHQIVEYTNGDALFELVTMSVVDHVLLINPNNPTGELLPRQQLEDIHRRVHGNGGWLVLDEAFADTGAHASLASRCPLPGLIVYRSLGKFFGLAGVRLGFMLAPQSLCRQLESIMPPWLLSHPARWIGTAALRDGKWQAEQHARLADAAERWLQTLRLLLPALHVSGTALFATGAGESGYCKTLYQALGRRALLVRIFEDIEGRSLLRFGLPLPTMREQVVRLIRESVEECECAIG
jgi:cobalamin biosynthesis protein CobC